MSDAAWEAACRDMEKALAGYETYKGHLGESAKTLYDCLRFDAYVGENLDRIVSYARLCQDVDLTDEHYQEMAVRYSSWRRRRLPLPPFCRRKFWKYRKSACVSSRRPVRRTGPLTGAWNP